MAHFPLSFPGVLEGKEKYTENWQCVVSKGFVRDIIWDALGAGGRDTEPIRRRYDWWLLSTVTSGLNLEG